MSYSLTTHKIPDCMARFWHANCMTSLRAYRTLLTSTNLHQRDCDPWISQCFLTAVFTLAILTVAILIGVMITTYRMVSAWLAGQILIILPSYTMSRTPPVFTPAAGMLAPPDLAFASVGPNSRLPDRRALEKFSRSQYRPSLITPPRFALAVPSMPVKRWNFRKAEWSHYAALTNKFAKTLLPLDSLDVDAVYQDFCNIIKKAAKKTIPRGYRNNYIPCWDAECESLYKTFLQSSQGDDSSLAATALLAKLDRNRRD